MTLFFNGVCRLTLIYAWDRLIFDMRQVLTL